MARPARSGGGLFLCSHNAAACKLFLIAWACWAGAAHTAEAPQRWYRDVTHSPKEPRSGDAVKISIKPRGQVSGLKLEYQVLDPGQYIELKDPAYQQGWLTIPMKVEQEAYVAEIPAAVQKHRRLVRYRFISEDTAKQRLTAPDEKSPSPNFAYFVYDGIPAWSAAIEPRSRDPRRSKPMTFPPAAMRKVQAYHLIARKEAVENVQWNEHIGGGKEFKYTGALVAGGEVYDHVGFRIRGGVWRYAMGKNMWKFDFPDGNRLQAHDDWGRPYPVKWSKVNLRPCISMGGYGRRGEQGMYESVGYRLFNLAGVPAPHTHWLQLRIIDEPEEAPANQYEGDFWGLYLAIENEDGRFLKAHKLPDGNLYKMFAGMGDLNHHAEGQPDDRSDLKDFLIAYHRQQTDEWWRKNLDLPAYYSYRAIVECIHHYDIAEGKNYAYYRDPAKGQWKVIPWDLDLTWGDHMYGNGEEPFNARVLSRPTFRIEYQNRLREIRDLLFNEEQCGRLIDEYAAVIGEARGPSIAEADRRKWDHHPVMAMGGQAGQGRFYAASDTADFAGMVRQMKDYVRTRSAWIDATLLDNAKAPPRPSAKYVGPAGFAPAQLRFRADVPKAAAAVQWRLAEVSPPAALRAVPRRPLAYEITPVWQGDEMGVGEGREAAVPQGLTARGKTYRVRVRVKDAAGRWSHWSAPIEFTAGA